MNAGEEEGKLNEAPGFSLNYFPLRMFATCPADIVSSDFAESLGVSIARCKRHKENDKEGVRNNLYLVPSRGFTRTFKTRTVIKN